MIEEQKSKAWIVIIVALIGCFGTAILAIATVGVPFAERYAERMFSSTPIASGVQPTSNPTQYIQSTVVAIQPQSNVQLITVEKTGESTRKTYSITLSSDEAIVGDAYDFQDNGYTCVAFLIRGPGTFQFAVLDGAWYQYSGVETDAQGEDLLQGRVQYLQNHWFCKNVAFPVERIEE